MGIVYESGANRKNFVRDGGAARPLRAPCTAVTDG